MPPTGVWSPQHSNVVLKSLPFLAYNHWNTTDVHQCREKNLWWSTPYSTTMYPSFGICQQSLKRMIAVFVSNLCLSSQENHTNSRDSINHCRHQPKYIHPIPSSSSTKRIRSCGVASPCTFRARLSGRAATSVSVMLSESDRQE